MTIRNRRLKIKIVLLVANCDTLYAWGIPRFYLGFIVLNVHGRPTTRCAISSAYTALYLQLIHLCFFCSCAELDFEKMAFVLV